MTAPSNDEKKLAALQLQSEGNDTLEELLEAVFSDSVSPGICMNDGCDYTTEVEPDQTQGWCEVCGTNTVKSAPILAGII
jgi:hypothetical protein